MAKINYENKLLDAVISGESITNKLYVQYNKELHRYEYKNKENVLFWYSDELDIPRPRKGYTYIINDAEFQTEMNGAELYYNCTPYIQEVYIGDELKQRKERENKMNYAKVENYEQCIIKVFAPGAAKNNTDLKIDHSTNELLVEVKPTLCKGFSDIDLEVKEIIKIDKKYNLQEVTANIATGIITIKIPVDTDVIQTIEID